MFYILSKILYFLIQPINWVFLLLLAALFSKKPKRKRNCLIWTVGLFLFFSNHFIFNQVIRLWEPDPVLISNLNQYDIGILAGGYSNFFIEPQEDRHHFNPRANRLTQTTELFFANKIERILLTGGSGYLYGQEPSEALEAKQFLMRLGIPDSVIIVESLSRNTFENAKYTKAILAKEFPNQSCLLITSAFHMPRTAACFKKAGIRFTPFCVDYMGEKTRFMPESTIIPDRRGFYHWEILVKEWVGYIMYKLRGYL